MTSRATRCDDISPPLLVSDSRIAFEIVLVVQGRVGFIDRESLLVNLGKDA
jgi:hypothetical protein